jgi:predicted Zn-ribbon and HTH transcriptional regulator
MSKFAEALPDHWGIRLIDFPQYDILRVQAPSRCPRCKASTIDAILDPSRSALIASWVDYKVPNPIIGIVALLLVVVTLGAWLLVMGTWMILRLPMRMSQKSQVRDAAKACVRSQCRSCGLAWYSSETAAIEAASKK